MILTLMKFFNGYLMVHLTGYSPERFLNLCSSHDILIWNLQYVDTGYEFYITVKGYRQIKPFVKKSKTRLKIIGKFGLPFFLHKNRKRKMYAAGFIMFGVTLYLMSIFIWDIQFTGNYTYTEDTLMDFLNENKIHHGMKKEEISCERIEQLLRNQYQEITWVSAQISGTRLIIKVKENYDLLTIEEKDTSPCDLLAAKDGIITEMVVRTGVPVVKVGDVVCKGQLLVSGTVPITDDGGGVVNNHFVHSDADIKAKTVYQYEDSFPLLYTTKIYTGRKEESYYIRAFDNILNLNLKKPEFSTYDIVSEEKQLRIFSNFYLPFYYGTKSFTEYGEYDSIYTQSQAEQLAKDHLKRFLDQLEEKKADIVDNQVKITWDKNNCAANGKLVTVESIVSTVKLDETMMDMPLESMEESTQE